MAKKKKKDDFPELALDNVNIQETINKSEEFLNQNKNLLIGIVSAIVLVAAAYFYYSKSYMPEKEADAQNAMYQAIYFFEQDSLDKAINGFGSFDGFKTIAEEYSMTKAGNLANYYMGISYLKKGQFEDAIDALNNFSSDDIMVQCNALAAIGDAYSELNKLEDALSQYEKAADCNSNVASTPIYLKKAGLVALELEKYDKSIEIFERLKNDYKEDTYARDAEKYIAFAKAKSN